MCRTYIGPLGLAIEREDYVFVAEFLSARFGVVVAESDIGKWFKQHPRCRKTSLDRWPWSDSSWIGWFKNRIESENGFLIGQNVFDIRFMCELHIGFITISEPEWMWAILRNEKPDEKTARPARSKISKTLLSELTPINIVAARVAPDETF